MYDDILKDKDLVEFLTANKREIEQICQRYARKSNDRSEEWEDFRQDATLLLCEIWVTNQTLVKRAFKTIVQNCCKNKIISQKRKKRTSKKIVGFDPTYHIVYVDKKDDK